MLVRFYLPVLALILLCADHLKAAPPTTRSAPVNGIVTDRSKDTITIRTDGEKEPIKYLIPKDLDKKTSDALKQIFVVGRVKLTYSTDGQSRKIATIEKVVIKPAGTILGKILYTHGWWIEIQPTSGPPEAFAASFPKEQWQATEEQIKTLKPGDVVTIKYTTDGERHRIGNMEKMNGK